MPEIDGTVLVAAPLEDVWKLVHDPLRYPEWWSGVGATEVTANDRYTMWPAGYPDYPMAQALQSTSADRRVTISCLVSDLEFRWQLEARGESTKVISHITIPPAESARVDAQHRALQSALARLALLATGAPAPPDTPVTSAVATSVRVHPAVP
jgi:uncharacterized protein YndB with AHSA1/START domain